ncbi:MAG TPA: polyphosphate kinase 2 family protein [Anaerolineae bacterium]|jgi:PPK2 family polyphosphate:nucleotide phosphotransferase|nr:polyphosphate kinase 2 family protein [Anaerolineae bacterium]
MDRYKVLPGCHVDLKDWDPGDTSAYHGDKGDGRDRLDELNGEMEVLQELLWAEHKHKVLILLQGMDTSGKDGTIRHVFQGVDPQGVRVSGFKVPTPIELDHDYLWRVHSQVPGRGEIVIFNRSHYEDVLVVRVHSLVPEETWSRRYAHISDFERMLAEEGTTILKFFLHIDLDEQKERLRARLNEPTKQWKFKRGDLKERKLWPEYTKAYEEVLSKTSTEWAPWYAIPANRKWYRNLAIATILVNTLKGLDMRYPPPEENLDDVVLE